MGEVVILGGYTALPIPIERVLDGAKDLDAALVLGWDQSGRFVAACSKADLQEAVYMAQRFIHKVHSGDYD